MRRLLLPALLSAAVLAAGCGSSDGGGSGGGGSGGGSGGSGGKALFTSKCGSCHTLKAAGTSGTFGPNLDGLKPSESQVRHAIAEGPGPMPAGLYDGAQAQAVAKFVSSAAGK